MPDRSTADTAGTAETVGTAAASDITRQVDALLDRSTDGIVMDSRDRRAVVLSRQTVYQGAVFDVEDMRIALPAGGGDCVTVRRQVCRHAPCVVMLVHDEARDLYLLEREYRVGSDLFAYGLPAGLMDDGEDVEQAALRELAEETGVVLDLSYDGLFDENTIEKTREEIKLLKVITNIMYININNNFSSVDYDNLYLYAKDRAKLMHGEESEVKLSRNPPFDRTLLIKTPMDKALFINDSSAKGAIKGRLKMNNKKNKKKINMQDMTKLNFYLMYLELLDKEINKTKNIELKDELIIAKYRLMYVLDSIYDLMNFKKRESSIKINGDYSFIETIIYFFIVEVLSYDDKEYKLDGTNKKDIITYYFNIIKKLYVETYYKLTNDRVIIDLINNSNFYNVNTISSKLFSNIVPSEKNKSKIKKKNF